MVLLWLMIIKFNSSLEFQLCSSTYCIRCCLKIAQGKKKIAATEGFLSHPKTTQQYTRWKIRLISLHGSFLFHPFVLEREIYEAIFIQSLGPICEIHLYQLKQVQRYSPCFGNRKWQGVLKSFMPVRFCASVTDGSSRFGPPKHTDLAVVVADFTGLSRTESSPQALADLLDHGPRLQSAFKFWTKTVRGAGGEKVVVIIFP